MNEFSVSEITRSTAPVPMLVLVKCPRDATADSFWLKLDGLRDILLKELGR